MRALVRVLCFLFLFTGESLGLSQEAEVDLLMSNGGITYSAVQNKRVVTISIIGPEDPYDVNHRQKIEVRIDGKKINASRERMLRIVKFEIANKGEKLSVARQSFLSVVMTTLLTDLRIKRWGLQLFNSLREGNWQHAFVERDPTSDNYDYAAPYVYERDRKE